MTYDAVDGDVEDRRRHSRWRPAPRVPIDVRVDAAERQLRPARPCTNAATRARRTFTDVQRHLSASDARSGADPAARRVQHRRHRRQLARALHRDADLLHARPDGPRRPARRRAVRVGPRCDADLAARRGGGSQNQSARLRSRLPAAASTSWPAAARRPTRSTDRAVPERRAGALGPAEPWNCVAIQTGGATNQVPARAEQAHPRRREGEDLHQPEPVAGGRCRTRLLLASDPRLAADVHHALRLVRRQRQRHGAGPGLRVLLRDRLGRLGRRLRQPLRRATATTRSPAGPATSSATSSSTSHDLNDGSSGDTPCDFDAASPCVAVLTD